MTRRNDKSFDFIPTTQQQQQQQIVMIIIRSGTITCADAAATIPHTSSLFIMNCHVSQGNYTTYNHNRHFLSTHSLAWFIFYIIQTLRIEERKPYIFSFNKIIMLVIFTG
jgi:hypothetical protein